MAKSKQEVLHPKVDPERLSAALVGIYSDLEDKVLLTLARALEVDEAGDTREEAAEWARRKSLATALVRTRLVNLLASATPDIRAAVTDALISGYAAGQATADLALTTHSARNVTSESVLRDVEGVVAREAIALTSGLLTTHRLAATRAVNAYEQVIAAASSNALSGATTRRGAAQSALTAFARAGIKGYETRDKNGKVRTYDLATYTEMATRKAVSTAAINGHNDRLVERGYDLVQVSDSPYECGVCRKWEGRVLSLTGATPGYPTLADAEADGLFHPGCTHTTGLYIPGVTKRTNAAKADPQGYADRQRLRALERKSREAHKEAQVAATPEAKRAAAEKKRVASQRIAEHVEATGQPRARNRENLTSAR